MQEARFDTRKLTGLALLIAAVIALTLVATFIKIGSFPITLSLVPIVVGAAVYGAAAGGILGVAMGVVVLIACITGADPGGHGLWLVNPLLTSVLCVLKSGLAGLLAGLVYKAISDKNIYVGVLCAAVICPVVNTGVFIAGMLLFFMDIDTMLLGAASEGTHIVPYVFMALAGVNFFIELAVNIVLAPAILRIINAVKRA
jgi:uncharacterized membrane protein